MEVSIEEKRSMIDTNHAELSIRKQCNLIGLSRSGFYYKTAEETSYNLLLMKLLDEEYTRYPFKGVMKMVVYLKELGHLVNPKRIRRLLRLMGLEAIYPKRNLSKSNSQHKKYPYLLNGLIINRVNQVWSADITYVRLKQGFIYLVAIMDWYSRYVLSWEISTSLDANFCVEALEEALMVYGYPEIFNTDQGVQFTSEDFINVLLANNIKISMDAKGRAFDNIFLERLWRTVKYEEIYLNDYSTPREAKEKLTKYFKFYNNCRHHQALDYKKPAEVHFAGKPVDYMNCVDNFINKVTSTIHVGPQAQ